MKHWALCSMAGLVTIGTGLCMPAKAELRNHLPDFLSMVQPGGTPAWLAYEAAHSRDLDALFYADRTPESKQALIAQAIRHPLPLEPLATLSRSWRGDFAAVVDNLEGWSSRFDGMDVSMWWTFDDRPWVTRRDDDRLHVALNARGFLPYNPINTRLRFSDVLFHVAIDRAAKQSIRDESLARRVQLEGLKMATAALAVPGHPDHVYLGCDTRTLAQLNQQKPRLLQAMMTAMHNKNPSEIARFFPPNSQSESLPGAGRYIAFVIARGLSNQHNLLELAQIPSDDYLFLVKERFEEGLSAVNQASQLTDGAALLQ